MKRIILLGPIIFASSLTALTFIEYGFFVWHEVAAIRLNSNQLKSYKTL